MSTVKQSGEDNKFQEEEYIMIPNDPVMLLSFVNLKLRDYYKSLKDLCDDLDINEAELVQKLAGIDYRYDQQRNQFV